jgi:ABC-type uncharacterized transport system permease subunit
MVFAGADLMQGYSLLLLGPFGSVNGLTETIQETIPILMAGMGVMVAFRARIWNIGADGQLYVGALFAAIAALYIGLPSIAHLPVIIVLGFVGGALYAGIPALLKVKLGVNEIITTIMTNYIAYILIDYMTNGPIKDPGGGWGSYPRTALIPNSAVMPILIAGTRIDFSLVVVGIFALLTFLLIERTKLGYQISVIGSNPEAARYGGISLSNIIYVVLILSGGLSGVAGMLLVSGKNHLLESGISRGYGFTAIVVAVLGGLHPIGVIVTSVLLAAFFVGIDRMHIGVGIPASLAELMTAVVLIAVVLLRIIMTGKWLTWLRRSFGEHS